MTFNESTSQNADERMERPRTHHTVEAMEGVKRPAAQGAHVDLPAVSWNMPVRANRHTTERADHISLRLSCLIAPQRCSDSAQRNRASTIRKRRRLGSTALAAEAEADAGQVAEGACKSITSTHSTERKGQSEQT